MDLISSIIDKFIVREIEQNVAGIKGWELRLERDGCTVLTYRKVFDSVTEAYSKLEELRKACK